MKLRTVGIVGFGKFRAGARPVAFDFGPGLNLVVGPNEAGKSTLQACIVRTLFGTPRLVGFPDYQPWEGGDYHAWMELDASDGHHYRVARSFLPGARRPVEVYKKDVGDREVLVTADGAGLVSLLEQELGTSDERVFYATACISQVDIDPMDRRFSGNLRHAAERAIGGGGSGDSTQAAALRRLNDKVFALQRATGAQPGPIVRIERELSRLREQETGAAHRHQRLHELHHLCRKGAEKRGLLRHELAALETQLANYRARTEAREKLTQVEAALAAADTRVGALLRLKEDIAAADRRLSAFPDFFRKDPALVEKVIAIDTELRSLAAAEDSGQAALATLPQALTELAAQEAALASRAAALEAESGSLAAIAAAQAEFTALEPRAGALEAREREIDDRFKKIEEFARKASALTAAMEKIPKAVRGTPPIEARAMGVQEKLAARKKALKEAQGRLDEAKKAAAGPMPSPALTFLLLGLAAVALIAGTWFSSLDAKLWPVTAVFALAAAGMAGAGVSNLRKRQSLRSERDRAVAVAQRNTEVVEREVAAAEGERKTFLLGAGLPTFEAVLQAAAQFRSAHSELTALQSALGVIVPPGAEATLKAEREKLRAEKAEIKARLDALRGAARTSSMTPAEIKARLVRLGDELPATQRELRAVRERLYGEEGRRRAIESAALAAGPRRADLERRKAEILALAAPAKIASLDDLVRAVKSFQDATAERRQKCATHDALAREGSLEALQDRRRGLALDRGALQDRIAALPGETLTPERAVEAEKRLAHLHEERERVEREFASNDDERKLLDRQDLDWVAIREGIAYWETRLNRLSTQVKALDRSGRTLTEVARHVRENLAAPLQHAISSVFIEMTQNNYTGVRVEVDPSEFTFRPQRGERAVDPESLSRGTRDQLYFAIRYGLARVMVGRDREPFLILDDPFTHFDAGRVKNVIGALRRISERAQVLLFTKDAHLAEDVSGWAKVIALPGPGTGAGAE